MTTPTLYDLFDETSLRYWERAAETGLQPDRTQLTALIDAHQAEPLPSWLNALILKALRGELRDRRGRPKTSALDRYRRVLAALEYKRLLANPPQAEARASTERARRHAEPRPQPPHERAAKMAIETWGLRIGWQSFLN